jgi:hypothetical protein
MPMLEKMMPSQERANELYLGKLITLKDECFTDGSLSCFVGNSSIEWVVVGCCPLPVSGVKPDEMVSLDVVSLHDYKTVHGGDFKKAADTLDAYLVSADEINTIKPL